ncbi:putative A1 protein [Pectobacterium phage DU_PP_V]|uniref:Putative A1 protein n=1 Tax=Pectobacterium phage DU_PP_V TaxID=2041492 RepID=A0A2D2W6Q9_9CAUD|nr:DNA transfer protein [Pectobacterium phage DU_PP_V]ATS93987.1 putative A1 protein [Pectobacterium phage DU_PP_V]
MSIAEKYIPAIVTAANDLNFYGKRLRSSRLAVCETISKKLFEDCSKSVDIHNYLEANKPPKAERVKASKAEKVDNRPLAAGNLTSAIESWPVISGKRFILTSVQNNTFPHEAFFQSLVNYAEFLGAKLLVSKYTYNKNGFQNGEGEKGIHYNPIFTPFLQETNCFLNNTSFAFLAQLNILPTANYPLSGFAESLNGFSAAIGHAQITSEAVPALKGEVVQRLYSTGTATLKNYIQQKAGQSAETRHCYGALLVEFNDEGQFWCRQLQTMDDSGEFYDLKWHITPDEVNISEDSVLGLQYGDIHAEKLDNECALASFGSDDSLLDFLRPKFQFIHDVHDFTSRNHHNRNSGVFLAEQYAAGRDKVLDDLQDTGAVLESCQRDFCQTIVVESNHDLALSRWLDDKNANITYDPANAKLFHQLNAAVYGAIESGDSNFNVLDYALRVIAGCSYSAVFLKTDESFKIAGIECGVHGHNGINGSRGAPKQYKKLGRLNTGHTHTPSIYGGVYTAGVTGSLDMGYNIGASSWCQTHIITYKNGARTLIDFKDGDFFALQSL